VADGFGVKVIVGLVALAGLWLARRRWFPAHRWAPLPATVVDTIATTIFALSGAWLAGLGVDARVVSAGHGSGQWLSAAPVALVAAAVFGTRLLRDLHLAS
jgi:MYXO-CTERM domain-containing protein